jgi:hypothetical protein
VSRLVIWRTATFTDCGLGGFALSDTPLVHANLAAMGRHSSCLLVPCAILSDEDFVDIFGAMVIGVGELEKNECWMVEDQVIWFSYPQSPEVVVVHVLNSFRTPRDSCNSMRKYWIDIRRGWTGPSKWTSCCPMVAHTTTPSHLHTLISPLNNESGCENLRIFNSVALGNMSVCSSTEDVLALSGGALYFTPSLA